MDIIEFDIVIVGGGMVGATLACALGGSELRVAIVEDQQPAELIIDEPRDLRVSAVSIASMNVFKTIGAWPGVERRRSCPFRRMRVWEAGGDVEFRSAEIGEPVLGYIVENRMLQLAALERARDFANVTVYCPARTNSVDYAAERSQVTLADGRRLSARLLIAADGGVSPVRAAAGLGTSGWDYPQHAFVLSVETGYPQQDITWQRFVPTGPQAFLPLDGAHGSLVWYHTPEEVKRLRGLDDDTLLTRLASEFPVCLGQITRITAKGSFPLRRQHALSYWKPGLALIGDAAHTIHPLAGQGVNIGLLDAAALAQTILAALRAGQDFGGAAALKQYEAMRRRHNLLMMTTMDLFHRAFGNDHIPLRLLRNLGLGMADRISPAKKLVMGYAMGVSGQLPRLARGEALVL